MTRRPPWRVAHFVALYALFAAFAIATNLLVQHATLSLLHIKKTLLVAMAFGTVAGLAIKYVLDKKWIFRYKPRNATHNLQTFIGYSVNGVATTAIFWASELTAAAISEQVIVRDTGATIGLVIGYYVKYRLDKRFVFKTVQSLTSSCDLKEKHI